MIIDTDCGIDDAVTIISAIKYGINILGVTTVSGNVYVDQVTDNVLRILNFMGRNDIPVFKDSLTVTHFVLKYKHNLLTNLHL
jgi:inosine-uridine nucleoside N-ribohydrolase